MSRFTPLSGMPIPGLCNVEIETILSLVELTHSASKLLCAALKMYKQLPFYYHHVQAQPYRGSMVFVADRIHMITARNAQLLTSKRCTLAPVCLNQISELIQYMTDENEMKKELSPACATLLHTWIIDAANKISNKWAVESFIYIPQSQFEHART